MYTINGYLCHHGILGQRWGVKNGPPYPLSKSSYSKDEKEAKKHGNESSKKGLTDKQKRYIRNGAIIAGVAIAAIGTAYLVKSGKINNLIKLGQKSVLDNTNKIQIPKNVGFKKISTPENDTVRLSKCNPNMTEMEKTYAWPSKHNMNCGNTVAANELRHRGFDVQACGNSKGMTVGQMAQYFEGFHSNSITEPSIDVSKLSDEFSAEFYAHKLSKKSVLEIKNRGAQVREQMTKQMLEQYPNGSRGALFFTGLRGSHWMSWENVNGKIKFENPQEPDGSIIRDLDAYFGTFTRHKGVPDASTRIIRMDDLKVKDSIREIVTDFGAQDDSGTFNHLVTNGANFVMKIK